MVTKKNVLQWGLLIGLIVIVAVVFSSFLAHKNESNSTLEAWNIYNGKLDAYVVEIDETKKNGVWRRLVHLEPENGYEQPYPDPFAITGHDYDGDYCFDRVFIRPTSVSGYNAVRFTGRGQRVWEPCGADKGKLEPFSDEQIANAQSQLYLAMAQTHNQEHIVKTLEDWQKKEN